MLDRSAFLAQDYISSDSSDLENNSDSIHFLDMSGSLEFSDVEADSEEEVEQDSSLFDSESEIALDNDDLHLLSDHESDFDIFELGSDSDDSSSDHQTLDSNMTVGTLDTTSVSLDSQDRANFEQLIGTLNLKTAQLSKKRMTTE